MKIKAYIIHFILMVAATTTFAQSPIKVKPSSTKHGPENGSLLIIGGSVGNTESIWNKFIALAGGKENAKIVIIAAGSGDSSALDERHLGLIIKNTGIKNVKLIHPTSVKEANEEAFIKPLQEATGVFFGGGRQWRIADYYLNTLAHQAFLDVLNRGGVIAGSSAGASIQGSLLWRGDTRRNTILIGDHTQGLAFLKNSVIDQHLLARNRQFDLIDIIKFNPDLIGLGIDEATAALIQKDTLEVIGRSYVAIYDYNTIVGKGEERVIDGRENHLASSGPFFFLGHGQKYDLEERKVIREP